MQQSLKMLLVPYRPSDNPPKLKQAAMLINNVRNSPRQLQMWMNHHAIYGSTPYMVMIGLYNGDCLATANKFTPKLGFEPLDKLKTHILTKPHLRDIPLMDDPPEVLQEYIYSLIRVYMKMLIFAIDSKGMKDLMAKTTIHSYDKIHEVFCKLCEQSQYVDGPVDDVIELIGREMMNAVYRYDAKQALGGAKNMRHNGLAKELKSTIEACAKTAKEQRRDPNEVELLFEATEELAKQNEQFLIDSGEGSKLMLDLLGTEATSTLTEKSTTLTTKPRDQIANMNRNRNLPRNANKRLLFTSSGQLNDNDDYDEHFPGRPPSEYMKQLYHYANHQDELPAGQDLLSFALEMGLSLEEAREHAAMAQEVFIDAEQQVTKEFNTKADETAEKLRLESVAAQERNEFRKTVIQATKAEILPLIRKEVDSIMQNNAEDDNMVYERDNYSDSEVNPFANSGPLVSMQHRRNNYQLTDLNQGVVTPFDVPYPPLAHSATFQKKPNSSNSYGQLRNASPHYPRQQTAQYIDGYCITCGQTPADCREMRPSALSQDPTYNDRCYLRDHPLACRVDLNINLLSHIRLAALSPDKLDKVLNASYRNGCLKGAPYSIIAETKANILSERESLGMVLANKST